MKEFSFLSAKPVWIRGEETEMNVELVLRTVLPAGARATLFLAAHSRYRVQINGDFFADGPARAAHGFFKVSVYDLSPALTAPENVVTIRTVGYNVNSFEITDQPSFVCAEITVDGGVCAATGTERDFTYTRGIHRMRRVQRYSFQRPFTECYTLDAFYDLFYTEPGFRAKPCDVAPTAEKRFAERDVPYCDYEEIRAKSICGRGILIPDRNPRRFADRSLNAISEKLKGFHEDELECGVVNELYGYRPQILEPETTAAEPVKLGINGFATYDMGLNTTGMIRLSLTAEQDAVLYAVFNEVLPEDGVPDPGKNSCANVVKWALQGGRTYDLVSFAPYTYRYIQIISMYAPCLLTNVSQFRECFPAGKIVNRKTMPDAELQQIRDAAVETFRQNATDIFMDCPSRERAGWLCDAFFTGRAEFALTGKNEVEHAFLESFLLPESFRCLPAGMLPMCYPSDHYDGVFIPNWAMWYALELGEHTRRTGDASLAAQAKDRMYALAAYLGKFENADGLLEKLESWVFVEWSEANKFTQDVNYPTNMLYAKFLETLGALYGDDALLKKADAIRETIRAQAYDGVFFRDNAVLRDGRPVPTENHTETAQYYAFFTGTADPQRDPALYERLVGEFGPRRKETGAWPDVPPSNAFIGNFLRLDLLFTTGRREQLLDEIRAFFLPMAQKTGTLWEYMDDGASCCHGFASSVVGWLYQITD